MPQRLDVLLEDKLFLLSRLDISGCLSKPEQMDFVTESPALSAIEYLNLSKCAINENSFQKIFDSQNLRNVEVLGLAQLVNPTKVFPFPAKTRYGIGHKIQVIDLRHNEGLNW